VLLNKGGLHVQKSSNCRRCCCGRCAGADRRFGAWRVRRWWLSRRRFPRWVCKRWLARGRLAWRIWPGSRWWIGRRSSNWRYRLIRICLGTRLLRGIWAWVFRLRILRRVSLPWTRIRRILQLRRLCFAGIRRVSTSILRLWPRSLVKAARHSKSRGTDRLIVQP
jgi:hypothetical protein